MKITLLCYGLFTCQPPVLLLELESNIMVSVIDVLLPFVILFYIKIQGDDTKPVRVMGCEVGIYRDKRVHSFALP